MRGVESLRELRPRAGRSTWRALYRQAGQVFVVAAVGPEAQADPRGLDRALRRHWKGWRRWRKADAHGVAAEDGEPDRAEELADPEIRREHERTALARAVAMRVIGHDIGQRAVCCTVGTGQTLSAIGP